MVRVVDLPDAAREQNQCLCVTPRSLPGHSVLPQGVPNPPSFGSPVPSVFSLSAPDVTSRLTVYCDGRFESDGLEGDAQ